MRSRTHAIAVAIIGMLQPPFSFVTGGIVGLTVLRKGLADGALVLAVTMVVSALAMGLWHRSYQPVVIFVLFTGLPVLLLAQVLRQTRSQGTTLTAAGAMGGVVLAGTHLLAADPVGWWRAKLERFVVQPIRAASPDLAPELLKPLAAAMQDVSMLMLSLAASTAVGVILVMLIVWLARWMHATMDNPGGFGKEFRALSMDRRVAFVAVALVLLALFAGNIAAGLFRGLLVLVIFMYTIQGIALVHAVVRKRGASVAWLVAVYAGILIIQPIQPIAILGLALTGFSDTWFDFRRRWSANV